MIPLLSIVIPTHRRPQQVVHAIAGAIDIHAGFDIEILVIPNGQDDTWQAVAAHHAHDPRIRWLHLPTGNASAARNHGISNARGKYLRFLDDDDYFLPAAMEQLDLIDRQGLDVCSAPLESTSPDGRHREIINLPATDDFVTAAIRSARVSLTQGSILKREFAQGIRWREDVDLYDDYLWMLDLVSTREAAWRQTPAPVCAYVQHDGLRLSRVRRSGQNSRVLVDALLRAHGNLQSQNRLSPERNSAAATALLTHVHSAFPASPLFLGSVIHQAIDIAAEARPQQPLFDAYPWLARHLLVTEWLMLPPRYLTRGYRRALWWLGSMREGASK